MSSLDSRIATPEGKRQYVRTLFDTIADRYDLITVLLSYGQDSRWKRRLVNLAAPGPGARTLDLATGTGDIAWAMASRGARVVGLDITARMVDRARAKGRSRSEGNGPPAFIVGDMLALPFSDASFEIVTIGYGLRNVANLDEAICEIRRVLKPGGRMLSLDFNRPSNALMRGIYLQYLGVVGGALGWILHGDPDTYRYIPASIRRYAGAAQIVELLEARGFSRPKYYPVLAGLMTIHQAHRD